MLYQQNCESNKNYIQTFNNEMFTSQANIFIDDNQLKLNQNQIYNNIKNP